ncbi:MAG: hypothetical protein ACLTI1_10295 [Clostridia bacterium]
MQIMWEVCHRLFHMCMCWKNGDGHASCPGLWQLLDLMELTARLTTGWSAMLWKTVIKHQCGSGQTRR